MRVATCEAILKKNIKSFPLDNIQNYNQGQNRYANVLRKTLVVKAAQVCAQDIIRSRLININNNKSFSNSAKFKQGLVANFNNLIAYQQSSAAKAMGG